MTNILEAIVNISNLPILRDNDLNYTINYSLSESSFLTEFLKNAFSNNFNIFEEKQKLENHSKDFSYQGVLNQPHNLLLKGGDSIEILKTDNIFTDLQLNGTHPKAKLFSSSHLINKYCRTCEDWKEKDILYTICHIPDKNKTLSSLWFIYGSIYAASENYYTDIKNTITKGDESYEPIIFSQTKGTGRINCIDPLGITNMRIRGMWLLRPPVNVFDYVYKYDSTLKFQLVAIIPNDKYLSFPLESREKIEKSNNINLKIENIKVKNPNNPVHLIDCKLITIKQ